mmetsp:Transcript_74457/g.172540  ORF Transcript_74457/g.172540 Transcript_74457/m.172540 type:complete len:164 (+) Transcript_74457:43-534(+)|eukprot:CAMPEP_0171097482 /NCGR_PEP_ID=MMETSP0766_2-20121228/47570_1 /TAXON_ID=439317 /ORGANISM="Gambierdiscus australes, Strain CAWD 149" /LENGTH=163 /DNA_ID=CAMNT_0011556685 /DNA_START=42 /DNA_END=533 /DNA_ORIENTATION=-
MVTSKSPFVGDAVEGYWPDDDEWLPATLSAVNEDGTMSIVWEDGSLSDVAPDYVRHPATRDNCGADTVDLVGGSDTADHALGADENSSDMEALLAAAAAAGACDEAEGFVAESRPPSQMHWAKALDKAAGGADAPGEERKRCRPLGLMTSAQAMEMAKKAKAK